MKGMIPLIPAMESLSTERRRKKEGKHERGERWSPLEDAKLCEQVAISFPKWKKIAKKLPGRSRNSCRYRWEKLSRGQETSHRPPPGFLPMTSLMNNPRPPYWGGCDLPWNIIMQWLPPPPPPPPSVGYGYGTSGGEEVMMNNMEMGEKSTLWIPKPLRIDDPDHEAIKSSIWESLGIKTTLWIPKPLRIDDPDHEAVKRSIWETLGIENEKGVGVAGHINGGGGIFKAFQSKKKPSRSLN